MNLEDIDDTRINDIISIGEVLEIIKEMILPEELNKVENEAQND